MKVKERVMVRDGGEETVNDTLATPTTKVER